MLTLEFNHRPGCLRVSERYTAENGEHQEVDEEGAGVDRHDGGGVAAAGRSMPAESAGRGTRRGGRAGGGGGGGIRSDRAYYVGEWGTPWRLTTSG